MSFKAKYVQRGEYIDYKPAEDVNAGDVLFIGELAAVAKLDIKAGFLGALSIIGVYEVEKATGAVDAGAVVYYNASTKKATTTPTAYKLGVAVKAALSADATVFVVINHGTSEYVEESSSSESSSSSQG